MHASGRQKKRRSQMKQKVFERREKNEKASTDKPKKTRKKHSNKKPTTPKGVIIKKQEGHSNSTSNSESSEEDEYGKRAIENNWERYEEGDEEAARLAKLSLNHSGSEESEEEIEYITVSSNGPPPDLNTLSKSPSELFVWEKVCLSNRSDGNIDSDNVAIPPTATDNKVLDDELDQLLDDTTRDTVTTTANSITDHTPIISVLPTAPLNSNTDELDTLLDELLD